MGRGRKPKRGGRYESMKQALARRHKKASENESNEVVCDNIEVANDIISESEPSEAHFSSNVSENEAPPLLVPIDTCYVVPEELISEEPPCIDLEGHSVPHSVEKPENQSSTSQQKSRNRRSRRICSSSSSDSDAKKCSSKKKDGYAPRRPGRHSDVNLYRGGGW